MNEQNSTDHDSRSMNNTLVRAIEFALIAHKGQCRKGTQIPYVVHPIAVAQTLIDIGCSEEVIIAGLLHDTIEDTEVTREEIRKKFGERVVEIVTGVSESDKSDTWENRKRHTIEKLKSAPIEILLVECADKLDNIRSMKMDLAQTGDRLWERFNRPKEKQKWYYENLAEVFEDRFKGTEYKDLSREFSSTASSVFT